MRKDLFGASSGILRSSYRSCGLFVNTPQTRVCFFNHGKLLRETVVAIYALVAICFDKFWLQNVFVN
jgi:hypothetical protein